MEKCTHLARMGFCAPHAFTQHTSPCRIHETRYTRNILAVRITLANTSLAGARRILAIFARE